MKRFLIIIIIFAAFSPYVVQVVFALPKLSGSGIGLTTTRSATSKEISFEEEKTKTHTSNSVVLTPKPSQILPTIIYR